MKLWLALFIASTVFLSGCTTPAPPGQGGGESIDDLGCFPKGCDLPPGMKELCQDFEAGEIRWPADCLEMPGQACRQLCEREKARPRAPVTFIVTTPENTPLEDDNLHIQVLPIPQHSSLYVLQGMEQVDEHTWRTSVLLEENQSLVHYRYWRNNFGDASMEELPGDIKGYREATVRHGDTLQDEVENWRWLPAKGEALPEVPSAAGRTEIIARVSGEKFQRGQLYYDFWWHGCEGLVPPTDQAMKESHADWAAVWPAWDYVAVDPLPEIGVGAYGHIHRLEDIDFHLGQVKKDGLNILLGPQVCCHNPYGQSDFSDEWWEQWFEEMDEFMLFFAEAAERHGVEYLLLHDESLMWRHPDAPSDIKERFDAHIARIKEVYHGKLGLSFGTGSREQGYEAIFPSGGDEEVFTPEQFDFFGVAVWTGLADDNDAPVEEMEANFREIVEKAIKPLHEKYGKPIVLSTAYPSVDGGMKDELSWDTNGIQIWDEYSDEYALDLEEQAKGYEAILRVVAETPYIVGFYPFNYAYTSLPLSKDWSIRGKPAETVVSGWYERFEEEGK